MVEGKQFLERCGGGAEGYGRQGGCKMKEMIRVEEEQDENETRNWKKAIEETRKRIEELKQPPPPANPPQPGQPAP